MRCRHDAGASPVNWEKARERWQAPEKPLAEGLRLATHRYRAGYSPFLEQLDAQRGLLSKLALVQAEADALGVRVQLYQAMGGGWSAAAIMEAAAN